MVNIYLSPSTQEDNKYVGGGTEEYYMNLIADDMEPYLEANGIQFTRNDPNKTVSNSIKESNEGVYDFHFAIHSNAAPENLSGKIQGADVYYYENSEDGKAMAEIVAKNLKDIYLNPEAVKTVPTTSLAELSRTNAPSILVETAFHDNVQDANWIRNNISEIAQNFVKSITEYFGMPFVDKLIDREGIVITRDDPLNMRSRPSTDASVILKIPKGSKIKILGQYRDWYVVEYNGETGYVRSDYINLI